MDRGEGSSLRQESVDPVTFADEATWSDGLSATTGGFARGTITATGVGAVTGADYVAIDVDVKNLSDEEIPLDSVVATLLVGDEALPAAPAYDVEAAADLSGTLAPGDTATGTYVFQVGQDIGAATFYLDVDGDHAVATFSGSFE
ncbi:Telomeric repeat-binding factor 2 [Arthrobacter agilis]|nr:Telomeric repeat-binding factor 2 [Arthrobacter agilis]